MLTSTVRLRKKSLVFHDRKPQSWMLIWAKWWKECISKEIFEKVLFEHASILGTHGAQSYDCYHSRLRLVHLWPLARSLSVKGNQCCFVKRDRRMWYFRAEAMSVDLHNCLFSRRSVSELCGNPPTLSCMQSIPYRMLVIQLWGNLR